MPATIYQRVPHQELLFYFKNKQSEEAFIAWHHLRHRTYDYIASTLGFSLPALDVTGRIDRDWLHRHAVRHTTLRQIAQLRGQNTYDLMGMNVHDEYHLIDWQRRHAIDHGDLDNFFGVV